MTRRGIHRKGVMQMTAYETVMVVLGILGLLISFGGLIIAFISFLDKKEKKKCAQQRTLAPERGCVSSHFPLRGVCIPPEAFVS